MRKEAENRDRWLAAVGAIPGTLVYRSEVLRGGQWQRSLPDGHPDCVWVGGGVAVWVEWKAPNGRLRPEQVAFRRALEAAGGHWLLARDPASCCVMLADLVQEPVRSALLEAGRNLREGAK